MKIRTRKYFDEKVEEQVLDLVFNSICDEPEISLGEMLIIAMYMLF